MPDAMWDEFMAGRIRRFTDPYAPTCPRTGGNRVAWIFVGTGGGPRSGPFTDQVANITGHFEHSGRSVSTPALYHQQTKNLLVSYSPKKLDFF